MTPGIHSGIQIFRLEWVEGYGSIEVEVEGIGLSSL